MQNKINCPFPSYTLYVGGFFMQTFGILLCLGFGLFLIIKGGDLFVSAAEFVAEASGIPSFLVGATVVSIATTLPEMLVSLIAQASGETEMAVGNAIGSVTANVGLILGLTFLVIKGDFPRQDYFLKSLLLIFSAAVVTVGGAFGEINAFSSLLLLGIFGVFMWESLHCGISNFSKSAKINIKRSAFFRQIAAFLSGAVGITFGAELLVNNGKALAVDILGISEKAVAVTVLAVGTSLPELATSLTAIHKGSFSLTAGNILGATILDLTLIPPLCALVSGGSLPVSRDLARLDAPFCLFIILLALIPALIKQKTSKTTGAVLLISYTLYIILAVG